MTKFFQEFIWAANMVLQRLAVILVLALGVSLTLYTVTCAFGLTPWLTLNLQFGDVVISNAGTYVQFFLAALSLSLCAFLPSSARVMTLENSHRNFTIQMQDVARAYYAAHSADRDGVYKLRHEFDSIRERIAHLREHPDLSDLEPSVIEVAAQMSHLSRDLAQTYSDRQVARARDFLVQRQQEIEDFNRRIEKAKAVTNDMRVWLDKVELDEAVARSQLDRLTIELADLLPELDPELQNQTDEPFNEDMIEPDPSDVVVEDDGIIRVLNRHAAE